MTVFGFVFVWLSFKSSVLGESLDIPILDSRTWSMYRPPSHESGVLVRLPCLVLWTPSIQICNVYVAYMEYRFRPQNPANPMNVCVKKSTYAHRRSDCCACCGVVELRLQLGVEDQTYQRTQIRMQIFT